MFSEENSLIRGNVTARKPRSRGRLFILTAGLVPPLCAPPAPILSLSLIFRSFHVDFPTSEFCKNRGFIFTLIFP